MNKRAPRRSDEELHQIILAARASGLSDFEYCRNNSIPSSTFYRTLARLRQQACELPARSERLECKQEVVPINISELPISREDRMHAVSHVVDEPSPASFEATIRITLGGSTLELTNQVDTTLVASILSMLNSLQWRTALRTTSASRKARKRRRHHIRNFMTSFQREIFCATLIWMRRSARNAVAPWSVSAGKKYVPN